MERYNLIINNPLYQEYMNQIQEEEKNRTFCKHNIEHSLDVARIAYIINLEKGLKFSKDLIYATALLHELGRCAQYKDNTPHHKASAKIAYKILSECNYAEIEKALICDTILNHSGDKDLLPDSFQWVFYQGDKLSRQCSICEEYHNCYWSEEMKNQRILY